MELGGEVGHRSTLDNGYIFDPYIGLHLLWDFVSEGNLQLANNVSAKQFDLRGRISGGFILQTGQNSHINVALQYDGLGSSDFEAFSAHARFVVPLD